MQNLDKPEF